MIDRVLAELFLEEKEQVIYYLELVSQSVINNSHTLTLPVSKVDLGALGLYKESEILDFEIIGDNVKIVLYKDNNWMLHRLKVSQKEDEIPETYTNANLIKLSEILPINSDWITNRPKFTKNFKRLSDKYSIGDIMAVAEFAASKGSINLNMFLTEKVFLSLKSEMTFKDRVKPKDRVDVEDYSKEQPW